MTAEQEINKDGIGWAIGALCTLNRIPFDLALVMRQLPPPYTLASVLHGLEALGLRAALRKIPLLKLPGDVFPCLAVLKPAESGALAEHELVLLLQADGERLLVAEKNRQAPVLVEMEDLVRRYEGHVLLGKRSPENLEEAGELSSKFGFRWFIPELLKYRRLWGEVLLASLALQLVGLAVPVCTQIVIDKVVVHHTVNTLAVIAAALAIFLVFNAAMGWVRQYLVLHTGNRIDAVLGHKVFGHLFALPLRYYQHRPTGVVVARALGVETIREFLSGSLVMLLLDIPFLIVFLAIMFWYSWQLTLIALAALAMISALSLLVTPLMRKRLNHQFMVGARNQAFLTEYVAGMETVKSLQMEPQLRRRYDDYLAEYLQAGFASRNLTNGYTTVSSAIDQAQTLAILCAGALLVMQDANFTVGMLVAFQMFSARFSAPVLRLVGLWQEYQQADIAVKRLGDIMNAPPEPESLIPARMTSAAEQIRIEGLGFRYSEEYPWLYRNLNFTVQADACTVVTGPSGCGKSTLLKLLLGFCLPQEGTIRIGGRDIRQMSSNELRAHYGVVPQETMLFSGSIYDNLVLANPHASFEQVAQACRLAEIHTVIEQLPQGYQTRIGEHGAGLSGGQKQRIAIARALLKQPKFLVFDEATSGLDEATAEQLARTVNQLKGKVGILMIAHRLPATLEVDQHLALGTDSVRTRNAA